jgi:hypothetical protein
MNKKPECKLIGENGNVFVIIGNVRRTLKEYEMFEEATEFSNRAFSAKSYDDVILLATEYVDIVRQLCDSSLLLTIGGSDGKRCRV